MGLYREKGDLLERLTGRGPVCLKMVNGQFQESSSCSVHKAESTH